jgi:alanine racemase
VTLIGRDQKLEISAVDLSILAGTSWYEIITQINPLVKKVYL